MKNGNQLHCEIISALWGVNILPWYKLFAFYVHFVCHSQAVSRWKREGESSVYPYCISVPRNGAIPPRHVKKVSCHFIVACLGKFPFTLKNKHFAYSITLVSRFFWYKGYPNPLRLHTIAPNCVTCLPKIWLGADLCGGQYSAGTERGAGKKAGVESCPDGDQEKWPLFTHTHAHVSHRPRLARLHESQPAAGKTDTAVM